MTDRRFNPIQIAEVTSCITFIRSPSATVTAATMRSFRYTFPFNAWCLCRAVSAFRVIRFRSSTDVARTDISDTMTSVTFRGVDRRSALGGSGVIRTCRSLERVTLMHGHGRVGRS